jgi:hypothetical protein
MTAERGRRLLVLALVIALVILSAGCGLLSGQESGKLTYRLPTEVTVPVGSALPGTDIRYERMTDQGAYLRIKGQEALKRKGDSVDWNGALAPAASGELRFRVAWYTNQAIYLVGTAKVVIEDPQPQALATITSSVKFTGPVAYSVAQDTRIPGTLVTYGGKTPDGAKLGGVEGYPFRKEGDSLLWEGRLREGVYCRFELRVLQYDEKNLRVGGLITLWITSESG